MDLLVVDIMKKELGEENKCQKLQNGERGGGGGGGWGDK